MSRVEIVVDELVVRGLSPAEARAAAEAFEVRLAELADADGVGVEGRAEAFRRLQPVSGPAGDPRGLGETVAAAVWQSLAGGGA